MFLTKIVLQDYGVYRGRNEFDFTCAKDKPIILVGGKNGAGKTSLFESIMLCFYGISATAKHSTKKSYEQFLARKIHKYHDVTADHASITIQFKFFHDGKETEYQVTRVWNLEGSKINEQLLIHKRNSEQDFKPLDTIEESHWQTFIEDLIPKGVAGLFFFDGEKIAQMAKEEIENITIQDSLRSLLGLDVVEQLRKDLQVNMVRNLSQDNSSIRKEYEDLKSQKAECLDNNERLEERLAQKQNAMDKFGLEIESLEAQITKIGGTFTSQREEAKIKLASKEATYDALKKTMQDQCMGVLPFSLIPEKLTELKSQIESDNMIIQKKLGDDILSSKIAKINSMILSKKLWQSSGLDPDKSRQIQQKLSDILNENVDDTSDNRDEMFGFSTIQSARILEIIRDSNSSALDAFTKNTSELMILSEEIAKLQQIIVNAAADDEVGPLISKLGRLNSDMGELQSEMNHIEETMSKNRAYVTHLDANIRNILSSMYKDEKAEISVKLTKDVQFVLDEFIEKLKIKKLDVLEDYLLEALEHLLHKKEFIRKVKINPENFRITLYGKYDEPISKHLLSEGEKQMFVTALLWALAKTSGRPLPFMIDTPLARLDEDHRNNIVKKFLPLASHQVIIFSTDTEIESDDYKLLEPYMTRSYVIQFAQEDGCTKIHDGYFWNSEGEKVLAVQ